MCKKLGRSAEQELQYAEELVGQNFSNYSAWHYRSLLLPRLHNEEVQTGGLTAMILHITLGFCWSCHDVRVSVNRLQQAGATRHNAYSGLCSLFTIGIAAAQ